MLQQVFPSLLRDILGAFHRFAQGLVAPGNDAHHPVGRHAKGGRQFAGVEHTQSATGSCSDIEQSATTLHALFDGRHQRLYLGNGALDGLSDPAVFLVDVPQQFPYRHLLQMVEARWLFCYFFLTSQLR